MYRIIILIFLTIPFTGYMQDSTKIDSLKKVARLNIGNTKNFDSKGIKFIRVTEDSRCPKGVECIWPGEVKAIIGFYENDNLVEEKEFVFGVKAINPDQIKKIITIQDKEVYVYNISPYPTSEKPIDPATYYLELLIK